MNARKIPSSVVKNERFSKTDDENTLASRVFPVYVGVSVLSIAQCRCVGAISDDQCQCFGVSVNTDVSASVSSVYTDISVSVWSVNTDVSASVWSVNTDISFFGVSVTDTDPSLPGGAIVLRHSVFCLHLSSGT